MTESIGLGTVIPSRATDPHTSHAAAEAIRVTARNQRGRLLRAYAGRPLGLTDDEAQACAADVSELSCYWKRCSELRAAGLIVATGETRKGRAGVDRLVCALTSTGKAALRAMA